VGKIINIKFYVVMFLLGISLGAVDHNLGYVTTHIAAANGDSIILHNNKSAVNPTFEQVQRFVEEDTTDKHVYSLDSYVCADYARDFHENAEKAGLSCRFIEINFEGRQTGHAIDCFYTTDQGVIYVEPETDEIINIKTGEWYGTAGVVKTINLID
jgi:hypothetical protein